MLDPILRAKRAEIARMEAAPPLAPRRAPRPDLCALLGRAAGAPLRIIAEIKPRSPSAGDLSAALAPPDRALAYAAGGAAMISVLCDRPFFGGGFDVLEACRDSLDAALGAERPGLLAKEFVLHAVQLDRAREAGADCVLLIARILGGGELDRLVVEARSRELEPLVEIASDDELDRALAAGARLVGVNARDLDTLRMDLERAARLVARLLSARPRPTIVHLSGLADAAAVAAVAASGADAALVGEALMRADDPVPLLREMVAAAR